MNKTLHSLNKMVSSSFFVAVLLSLVLTKTASSKKLLSPKESIECPTLCDDIKLDAVTPINHLSPKILVVSGSCAWIVDTKSSNRNHIKHGFKHSFTFSQIQDMVSIRNSSNIEFVSIYASGSIVEVIHASENDTEDKTVFFGSNVFPGLSVDLDLPIDAAFAWMDSRIIYIFQGSKYWAFEMTQGWKTGGRLLEEYPRDIIDFGLTSNNRISTAFSDANKIYFISMDLVYTFDVRSHDMKTGFFHGSLSKESIKLRDMLMCPKVSQSSSIQEMLQEWFGEDSDLKLICWSLLFIVGVLIVIILLLLLVVLLKFRSKKQFDKYLNKK